MRARILILDDGADYLQNLRALLEESYDVDAASNGTEGLQLLLGRRSYAVVISDMHMPGMNGVEFFTKCEMHRPLSTRILLTGDATRRVALSAANVSHCFRVLPKIIQPAELLATVELAVRHHERAEMEHELLETTLRQSVNLLLELFSASAPALFEMSLRLQRTVRRFAEALNLPMPWEMEMAAGLARIGMATLPPGVVTKLTAREKLSPAEQALVDKIPEISAQMIEAVPRLARVADIIRYQWKHFDGSGLPANPSKGDMIPVGARILKIFTDRAWLEVDGIADSAAREKMEARRGVYDPELLAASFEQFPDCIVQDAGSPSQFLMVPAEELKAKQVAVLDIVTTTGLRLAAAQSRLTAASIQRIRNHCELGNLTGPFCVQDVPAAETKKTQR
ncbi:MAG TPA: HD domain-containing phosphohydrolase [Candidatus Didemnitutus sp.]|jgi:response regulator RpfG family c-di-GMP phosphodiesterase